MSSIRQGDTFSVTSPTKVVPDGQENNPIVRKHINGRANSEPPTEFINSANIEEQSEEEKQGIVIKGNPIKSKPNLNRGRNTGAKVPPIMVSQVKPSQLSIKN